MPYSPQTGDWYADRVPSDHYDTWKRASEQLALDVEVFLYDLNSPSYANPSFLAWAVARFDATKTSSGNLYSTEYDPEMAALAPIAPPAGRTTPLAQRDDAIRYPADARAAAHIDTNGGES